MVRKIISLLLVFVMMMGLSISVFADDTGDYTTTSTASSSAYLEEYYEGVGNKMKELGILEGYPDGSLHLDYTITRAEFVTMLVRTLGYESMLGLSIQSYEDVPETHWAKEYIALATSLGYIGGYGDNRFGPEDNITAVQAEAILLRVMGYGQQAEQMGWPRGYNYYAYTVGLTDGVLSFNEIKCTRGDVAKMIDNSLTIPFFSYSNIFGIQTSSQTILTTYLKHTLVKGTITDTALTDKTLEYNEIKLDGKAYTVTVENAALLVGDEVKAFVDKNNKLDYLENQDEDVYGYITETVKNKVLGLEGKDVRLANEVTVTINGSASNANALTKDMFAKVLYDEKGYVDTIYAFNIDSAVYVLDKVENSMLKATNYATNTKASYNIANNRILVYKNGVFGDEDSLAVNDTFSVVVTSKSVMIFVTNNKATGVANTGVLSTVSAKDVTIDGVKYELANTVTYSTNNNKTVKTASSVSDLANMIGLKVTVLFNSVGKVTHIYSEHSAANSVTGLITKKYLTNKQYVQIFNFANETYEVYNYTAKTKTNTENYIAYDDLKVFGTDETFSVVTLDCNDTDIVSINAVELLDEATVTKLDVSSIVTEGGRYYTNTGTTVIRADNGVSNLSVVDWNTIKDTSVDESIKAVVAVDDSEIKVEYLFITAGYDKIGKDIEYGCVESLGANLDGNFYEVYTGTETKIITLSGSLVGADIGEVISYRINVSEKAIDVAKETPVEDTVKFCSDNYVEFETENTFYQLAEHAIIVDATNENNTYYLNSVNFINVGATASYVLNNSNEIVYLAVTVNE